MFLIFLYKVFAIDSKFLLQVKDHSGVRREFVLTAFSIHPSTEIYRRVEEEAIASGKASPHSISPESLEVGVLSEGLSSLSSEETEGKETVTDYSVNNDSQDSGAFVEVRIFIQVNPNLIFIF